MTRNPKPHVIRVTHNGKEQIFKIVQTIADDEIRQLEVRERYLSKFQICQKSTAIFVKLRWTFPWYRRSKLTLQRLGRRSALNVPYGSES